MTALADNLRLIKRAYWLIHLRWIAIGGAFAAAFAAGSIFNIPIHQKAIYCLAIFLAVYNTAFIIYLRLRPSISSNTSIKPIKFLIDLQIQLDLITLTVMIHFSGGIENPFIPYYVFHMALASILLSERESYLHCTLSTLLFGLMVLLEYKNIIPHYCIIHSDQRTMHYDGIYVLGFVFGFSTTLFLVVYMTSFVAVRLKNQERAAREASEKLQQKDRVKDEYVARVTHDIKGHLAAIQSCLEVVSNKMLGDLNERQGEFVERAYERTKKLTVFVRTLLRLTKMRLSDKVEMEDFSVEETLNNALMSASGRAISRSIKLCSSIQPSIGLIRGNQFSVEEAVTNILLNSIKYTPEKGTVSLKASVNGDSVAILVTDTGIGIPADEIEHVFEEFYRASNAKLFERDGTGLGLSIVKQIIERHGGTISAESRENEGTTFKLVLPIIPNALQEDDELELVN